MASMTMNLTDPGKIDNTTTIIYNFPPSTIQLNQFQKSLGSNDKYIHIPFSNSTLDKPNIQIEGTSTTSYNSTNLYICGKLHNISDLMYDGELIIETTSSTNTVKVFACFLLKTDKNATSPTEIDTIINQSVKTILPNTSLNVNKYIKPEKKHIMYIDKNNNYVVIFTSPILVKTEFSKFSNETSLFSLTSLNGDYNILQNMPLEFGSDKMNQRDKRKELDNIEKAKIERDQENERAKVREKDRIDTKANLTDAEKDKEQQRELDNIRRDDNQKKIDEAKAAKEKENKKGKDGFQTMITKEGFDDGSDIWIDCSPTGESADKIAMYNLPISSDLMGDINQTNFMRTTMNFFVFLILCLTAYMVVPFWYKNFIMDIIHASNVDDEVARLKAVDILLCIIVFTFSLYLSIDGIKSKNVDETTVGVMSFILLIVSLIIMIKKKSSDENFSFIGTDQTYGFGDFGQLIIDTVYFIKSDPTTVLYIWAFISFCVWFPTYYIYKYYPELMPNSSHTFGLITTMWLSYGSIFTLYLTKLIGVKLANYE
jgi:hypothetical protein